MLEPTLNSEDEIESSADESVYGSDADSPLADIPALPELNNGANSKSQHTYYWRKRRPSVAQIFSFRGDETLPCDAVFY